APSRLSDESGEAIGYTGKVVFPLHVVPADAGRPEELSLTFFYAACEKICVPVTAYVAVELLSKKSGSTSDIELLDTFAKLIPREPSPGAGLAIADLSLDQKASPLLLKVTLRGSLPARMTDMF